MNVYDKSHELATAIKESAEFKEYQRLKGEMDKNPELSKMISDFQNKQLEIQAKQITGQEIEEGLNGQIQELYSIIMKDPKAAEYMQAEMRFSIMMNDVYKILGEVMGIGNLS